MQVLRITRGRIKSGTWDQFEAALHDAVEKAGHIPGLLSRSLARDMKDPDEGYAISVWESMDALEHYERSDLAKTITPMIQSFFTGDYRTDHCELRHWNVTA